MSPVSVKLGDFGVSKWIPAEATTTFHTQVSTQVYSAPEVQGLDSNSETSNYTNSVDIWSLGCVIYELLVGTRLFLSEAQVSRYYFGKRPFPEDKLKALLPPTDHVGISLLKSMLMIQPEDRPTATAALRHTWFVGLKSGNEDSVDCRDAMTKSRDESIHSGERKSTLTTNYRQKEGSSERNPTTQNNTKCIPRYAALAANAGSKMCCDNATPRAPIDTRAAIPSDLTSTESSTVREGFRGSGLVLHHLQSPHPEGPNELRGSLIGNVPQTCSQSSTPKTKPHPYKTYYHTNMNPRPPAAYPPTPNPYGGYSLQPTTWTNSPAQHNPMPSDAPRTPAPSLR